MWQAVTALAELRPTAVADAGSCTRRHASGCSRCAAACPVDAVRLGDLTATIDPYACIGCGLCVPACPVEAVSGVGAAPVDAARQAAGGTVRCDVARALGHRPEGEWVDVPCVAALHADTLTAAALASDPRSLSEPATPRSLGEPATPRSLGEPATPRSLSEWSESKGLHLLTGPCASCPTGMAGAVDDLCAAVSQTLAATGPTASFVRQEVDAAAPARRGLLRRSTAEPTRRPAAQVSRRALFGMGGQPAEGPAVSATPRTPTAPTRETPRRVLLGVAADVALPAVTAEPGCTACGGCVRICPPDALSLHRLGPREVLTVNPRDCVACGECVRVCPEQVLSLAPPAKGTAPRVIATVGDRPCSRCHRTLGPDESDPCHACATRASLADDVWAQLGL